jgi:CHAD domain-containing protein
MPPARAFVMLARTDLVAVRHQLTAVLQRDDVEDVHALRVAIRHLRAVLWTFSPMLPASLKQRWKAALRDLAHAAGNVRDWDVFLEDTLRPACDCQPQDPVLLALRQTVAHRRASARQALLAQAEDSRRGALPALARELTRFAHGETDDARPLDKFAGLRIGKARKDWKARWRHDAPGRRQVRHGPLPGPRRLGRVHALRIRGKRLRYAIEALGPVLPDRYARRLHRKLVKRQSLLGRMIDDSVARKLLAECLDVDLASLP